MSEDSYRRLQGDQGERRDLWEFVSQWRESLPADWQGLSDKEVRSWRDKSSDRD
jgi:hypothetical protein